MRDEHFEIRLRGAAHAEPTSGGAYHVLVKFQGLGHGSLDDVASAVAPLRSGYVRPLRLALALPCIRQVGDLPLLYGRLAELAIHTGTKSIAELHCRVVQRVRKQFRVMGHADDRSCFEHLVVGSLARTEIA